MLIYAITIRPYIDDTLNKQQIVNETFVLLSAYMIIMFSDYVPDDAIISGTKLKFK